jgi:hypothetical protein
MADVLLVYGIAPRRGKLSAAAISKIQAVQRARWAKWRKQQKEA